MTQSYEYDVQMSCGGCASAVRTAIRALPDVQSVETSVEKQKVSVVVADNVAFGQVKAAIQNAGKQVNGGRVIEGDGATEKPIEVSRAVEA